MLELFQRRQVFKRKGMTKEYYMRLNPNAIAFWILTTIIGFLFSHTIFGALGGLAVGIAISLFASLFL